jgi:hypothetical protein
MIHHEGALVNTRRGTKLRFLALIPHRDARRLLRDWSARLFAAGMSGAWAFPWAAPLALLSRPLGPGELRDAAFALREANRAGDGKFRGGAPETLPLPDFPSVYGLSLNLVFPGLGGSAAGALVRPLAPVLGAALTGGPEQYPGPPDPLPPPPETAFRAAALACLICRSRPLGSGALVAEWKIGRARWLPAVRRPPAEKAAGRGPE